MRCTECNYALWNLKARQCPECGTPFQPSEFEFVCNSVQFCCLHCDQPYYGTGQRGHLVPQSFECVKCGQHTHMNEMVLRPGEGLREEQTNVDHNPWLNRARVGRMKAFWSSIGMALVGPFRMMRATPQESSVAKPFWFMLIVVTLSTFVGMIPTICMLGLFSFTGSAGTGTGIALRTTGLMLLLFFLGSVAFVLVFCIIWGLTAHGLLKVTGETAGGLGRTFHAIFYGGGAYVMTAIPCAGRYVGIPW